MHFLSAQGHRSVTVTATVANCANKTNHYVTSAIAAKGANVCISYNMAACLLCDIIYGCIVTNTFLELLTPIVGEGVNVMLFL